MSDIFLKCPASCNATVSHSSKREPTLVSTWLYGQVLTNVSTWCTLNLAWGRCTWATRCNYRPELYPLPWSQTWRGTVAGTWKSYHQLTFLRRYIKVSPWRPLERKISWESGGIFPAWAVSDTRLLAHDGTFGQAPGFHGLRKELGLCQVLLLYLCALLCVDCRAHRLWHLKKEHRGTVEMWEVFTKSKT